jgi:hypothetical protein
VVQASPRSNQKFQYEPITGAWIAHVRGRVERRIGLFPAQFHAGRTLNRKAAHYRARRLCKAAAHSASRHMNAVGHLPPDSTRHFRAAA